jgi:predicted nuclease of predicted toxin-antitoxin system
MPISFYFDEMMSRAAANQLINRGIVVVLANDVGMTKTDDSDHLAYATQYGHVMVTFDRPFAGRTTKSMNHSGLICLSGSQDDIGMMVRTLTDFVETYTNTEVNGKVFWL